MPPAEAEQEGRQFEREIFSVESVAASADQKLRREVARLPMASSVEIRSAVPSGGIHPACMASAQRLEIHHPR